MKKSKEKEKIFICPLCGKKLSWTSECFGHGDSAKKLSCDCGFGYAPYGRGNFDRFLKKKLTKKKGVT